MRRRSREQAVFGILRSRTLIVQPRGAAETRPEHLIMTAGHTALADTLARVTVRCMECGAEYPGDRALTGCPACGGLLDVVTDIAGPVDPATFGTGLSGAMAHSGVWRYWPLLPAMPAGAVVSRWEGNTPLYEDARLADYAGMTGEVRLKHEGHNPTASFKDRGMTVGVSHAKAIGARIVACASTGNTSASLASYASAGGLASLVLIPDTKVSMGKLAQTVAYGAQVVQVAGDFDAALAVLRELTAAWDVYLVNSVNPFRLEGQKTIIIETMEQYGWNPPDYLVLPGGNLGNTAAFGKALAELVEAKLIPRAPKLVVVQAAGAAPFAAWFRNGYRDFQPVSADTVATAIKIGNPASAPRARRSIEFSHGFVTSVSDEEILDAKALIDRIGIGCEPASAASLAGLRMLVGSGDIPADATAACVVTGHVLKDTDAVIGYHFDDLDGAPRPGSNRPVRVEPTLAALERTLADALHG
jgi:threonine synthase